MSLAGAPPVRVIPERFEQRADVLLLGLQSEAITGPLGWIAWCTRA
jgi:hypothetical protein